MIVEKRAKWACIIRINWTMCSCFAYCTFPDLNHQTSPNFEPSKHLHFIILLFSPLWISPVKLICVIFFTNNIWVILCFLRILFNRIWSWLPEWGILRCYFLWYVNFYRHDSVWHHSLCLGSRLFECILHLYCFYRCCCHKRVLKRTWWRRFWACTTTWPVLKLRAIFV